MVVSEKGWITQGFAGSPTRQLSERGMGFELELEFSAAEEGGGSPGEAMLPAQMGRIKPGEPTCRGGDSGIHRVPPYADTLSWNRNGGSRGGGTIGLGR